MHPQGTIALPRSLLSQQDMQSKVSLANLQRHVAEQGHLREDQWGTCSAML
jgi:hypothetical protein